MYKVGVMPGKYLPPHRGHLNAIIEASTKCERLYVVVSHHEDCDKKCLDAGIKPMSLTLRAKWLSEELADFDHIEVLMLDETGIPSYPFGWQEWSNRLNRLIPLKIDVIFGGEPEYSEGYTKFFPEADYEIFDANREAFPISATMIRENPLAHWKFIPGSVRPFFTKRILITGSESCGKTTLTKMLAKIYFTSWAREEGRYYSTKYFGGNEDVFQLEDFFNICWEQRQLEDQAARTSNRIVFFDTDATVTQYYCKMYMGEEYSPIETMIDPDRYDIVLMATPDVEWVDDGFRWNSDTDVRWKLHAELKDMYEQRGFKDKIIEISGDYGERLAMAKSIVDNIIGGV